MTDLLLFYDFNVWHRRCVLLKAMLVTGLGYQVMEGDEVIYDPHRDRVAPDHPAAQFVARPNENLMESLGELASTMEAFFDTDVSAINRASDDGMANLRKLKKGEHPPFTHEILVGATEQKVDLITKGELPTARTQRLKVLFHSAQLEDFILKRNLAIIEKDTPREEWAMSPPVLKAALNQALSEMRDTVRRVKKTAKWAAAIQREIQAEAK